METRTLNKKPQNHQKIDKRPDKRFKVIDITMKRNHYRQDALIEILHKTQEAFGYLEPDILEYVAHALKLPLSRVYGVATFYHLFSLKPSGEHTCIVCLGTACYVKGSDRILATLQQELGIQSGETTSDNQISLLSARCLGACGIAPAVVFDGEVTGKQTPENALKTIKIWQEEE
ncbi:bidirectional hydrogenase complex protein HoxE [Crocosphaera sp. UHCC 0190]|uniref:bidirectional hydrogenase complex protein HoxE n=1 Tax=Crocosphaera sp. UHCC 0190 TaxID=3110246 RepID=UPI002B20B6F2|nr:bidirectional hydrogenase complex protein HoxE [Crocosphaera sp. UHCC 0190]MEA5509979.1 bidirectional hydrogenase complex protein HoxE [Crocosphaera sp. UHCC 0190]